jgi:hypothetical protein
MEAAMMLKLTVLCAVLVLFNITDASAAEPAKDVTNAQARDIAAASWSELPCEIVLEGDKWGNKVPNAAVDYLSDRGFGVAAGSGSAINLSSFIYAQCHKNPKSNVGSAINKLLHTPVDKLPLIPRGGA